MAQAALRIYPEIADANNKVVVAGNHRIRILDHRERLTYSILKVGFEPGYMKREVGGAAVSRKAKSPGASPSANW